MKEGQPEEEEGEGGRRELTKVKHLAGCVRVHVPATQSISGVFTNQILFQFQRHLLLIVQLNSSPLGGAKQKQKSDNQVQFRNAVLFYF